MSAVKHASDAIGVVNSVDGSLSTANDLLLRMRELVVQASSEINTKEERKHMQDEVSQINMALNRLATDTAFNNKKLLDGTYNAKILTGESTDSYNDIDNPNRVAPKEIELKFRDGIIQLPPHSLTIVEIISD